MVTERAFFSSHVNTESPNGYPKHCVKAHTGCGTRTTSATAFAPKESFDMIVLMALDSSSYSELTTVLRQFAATANGAVIIVVLGPATAGDRIATSRAVADAFHNDGSTQARPATAASSTGSAPLRSANAVHDMQIRNLAENPQKSYMQQASSFAGFGGRGRRSPFPAPIHRDQSAELPRPYAACRSP
jgi:hypothetical protein